MPHRVRDTVTAPLRQRVNDPQAQHPGCAPNAPRCLQGCRTDARVRLTADASRLTVPAAIPSRALSVAGQSRRRSSGTHCAVGPRRSPRRTCTHSCRCVLPSNAAEGPYRRIRSSAGVAAPWWSRHVVGQIIANHAMETNDEFPSIPATQEAVIPGCATRTRVYPSSALSLSKSATADLDAQARNP
jgi:hypothetical protein